ncbi:MAG: potassium channel protein [Magnetococcus sp. WYHC-3]
MDGQTAFGGGPAAVLPVFRPFRLLRVLRLLKLFRYSHRLGFFARVLNARSYELVSLFTVAGLVCSMVALAFFVVERHNNPNLDNLWEAFYWTIVSVTTVGYGDIAPTTHTGQLIAMTGIISGIWVMVFMTSIIMSGVNEHLQLLKDQKMDRELSHFRDHFVVCGLNSLGMAVCRTLKDDGQQVVAIDRDPAAVDRAHKQGIAALLGDVTQEEMWKRLGLPRVRAVISAITDEAVNVYMILLVRDQRRDCQLIVRGNSEEAEKRLRRVGADRVFSPYQTGCMQMALAALRPNATRLFDMVMTRSQVEIEVEEVPVAHGSTLVVKPLKECGLRQDYNVLVLAIGDSLGHFAFNPTGDRVLREGDMLVVVGHQDDLARLSQALGVV